jgi:hypothetical protein
MRSDLGLFARDAKYVGPGRLVSARTFVDIDTAARIFSELYDLESDPNLLEQLAAPRAA